MLPFLLFPISPAALFADGDPVNLEPEEVRLLTLAELLEAAGLLYE